MRAASASSAVSKASAADPLHMAPGGGAGTGIPLASRTTGLPTEVASFTNVSSCMVLLSLKMLVFSLRGRSGAIACNPAKHRTDRHTYTRRVTLAQNIAGHHLACHEQVLAGCAVEMDNRMCIHLQTQIREGDAWTQRVGEEWRLVQRKRPVSLVDAQTLRVAVIQLGVIETARHTCLVEFRDGLHEGGHVHFNTPRQFFQCVGLGAWEDGGHEAADGFGVDNGPGNLARLHGD